MLPYPSMSFTAFDVLTAAEMNQLVANIESLSDGSGIQAGAITAPNMDSATMLVPDYANMTTNKGTTWTVDAKGFVLIRANVAIFGASTVTGTVTINSKTVIDIGQGNNAAGGNGVNNTVEGLFPVNVGDAIGQTGTISVQIYYIPPLWV